MLTVFTERYSSRAISDLERFVGLERQPAKVQRLLLNTSLLERVNGQLADLMTGSAGSESESEKMLLDLEDANAFVISVDPERTWFRCHQLFGESYFAWSCGEPRPPKSHGCTDWPRTGLPITASRLTRSDTCRRRAIGWMRHDCSQITRSV